MPGIDIESDFITKDKIDNIWEYINSINTNTAKVFYLHFILDMTFQQIANELSINESTIKSDLYRMLKKVKKFFSGGEEIEK